MQHPQIYEALAGALAARGYEQLTPVQSAVLAEEADGRDLIVSAKTGSGKTVAFGMAMAQQLLEAERLPFSREPLGLVVAPTRELAIQVSRELDWLYANAGARVVTCVGGMDPMKERRALAGGAHIVVGTPGRLRDHLERGALDLSSLRVAVLDEADEMLDMGFREEWKKSSMRRRRGAARCSSRRRCLDRSWRSLGATRKTRCGSKRRQQSGTSGHRLSGGCSLTYGCRACRRQLASLP